MSAQQFIDKLARYKERIFAQDSETAYSYEYFLNSVEDLRAIIRDKNLQRKVVLYPVVHSPLTLIDLVALALEKAIVVPMDSEKSCDPRIMGLADEDLSGKGKTNKFPQKEEGIEGLRAEGKAALVLSSSGSTGEPKWVLHDMDALLGKYLKLQHRRTVPLVYQMDNVSGIEVAISIASAGGTLLAPDERSPQELSGSLQSLGAKPDLLSMTPSYLKLLLLNHVPEVYSNVQHINLGGERLLKQDLELFKKAFPMARIHSFYGTTETSSIKTSTKEGSNWIKWGQEGVDFKVIDGELLLAKGPNQMRKQLFAPLSTDEWYATGDWVVPREEGYYEVVGRKDAVFNVGGKKVDPMAVEQALLSFGQVQACKVLAEPNALLGNMVVAKLVAKKEKELEANLRKWCAQQLPEHAQPMKYYFVQSFEINKRLKAI